jgi:1-acyl-sn-glycerol-3-phosphate acyltransferase
MIAKILGSISLAFYFFNTVFWFTPIMVFSVLKVIPLTPTRKLTSYILDFCAASWIKVNTLNQLIFSRTRIDVEGMEGLSMKDWYLVIANHQSWVDILVLQRIFSNKIPFLKFFLKKELIYVPFLGLAWWALDFPFMRRYSKQFLAKNPHLKGKDIETTKQACEKFKYKPVSVMNFVEGTRFTEKKHQQSEFKHLLTPKAGGIAFVLGAMGNSLKQIVDVTIYYPQGRPTYWQFVSGAVDNIKVHVRTLPIETSLIGDYFGNEEFRQNFQSWVNQLWQDKDERLALMQRQYLSDNA